jgi:hypothetical protein
MAKKLPLGLQDFRKIRELDLVYIDKTEHIFDLVSAPSAYFLSRPRRFGKSITLSILNELYRGSKALFAGLWIESRWDWEKTHPVIHLSLRDINFERLGLEKALLKRILETSHSLGVEKVEDTAQEQFRFLIRELGKEKKVVVLIDEYDSPIIHYLGEDLDQATENRDNLKSFFSVLKEMDANLEFVLITGVSKFSKVGTFSGLNNLTDLTVHPAFATMLGFTQKELEDNFAAYIDDCTQTLKLSRPELMEKMRLWYNGYRFEENAETVYNPVSINSFFNFKKFENYWFETGTPRFLINLLKEKGYYSLKLEPQSKKSFDTFELENLNPYGLMYQTGYLTIKFRDEFGFFHLDYPNREVEDSMNGNLIDSYLGLPYGDSSLLVFKIETLLRQQNVEEVIKILTGLFKSIPYQEYEKYPEKFYHAAVHLIFSYMGLSVYSEVPNSNGRLDALVETENNIYIFEFKLDQSADLVLQQIRKKAYYQAFWHKNKPVIGVGINFSSQSRTIDEWKMEEMA